MVALPKPDEWYFQRYIAHLPAAGEWVLFDRSWYNRAGVEKVKGFCSDAEYETFLRETPYFEQSLVESGILLFKYWLAVDQGEQEARFAERANDPLMRWKLSPIDLVAREKYRAYGKARDVMFEATHRACTPWVVVDFQRPVRRPADADPPPARPRARLPATGRTDGTACAEGKAGEGAVSRTSQTAQISVLRGVCGPRITVSTSVCPAPDVAQARQVVPHSVPAGRCSTKYGTTQGRLQAVLGGSERT